MRYDCAIKVYQHPAPPRKTFAPGIGVEASPTGGRGDEFRGSNFSQSLWDTPLPCILIQVPWEIPVGDVQQLDGVSTQPQEGAAEVGASDKVIGERCSRFPDFRNVINDSCAGSLVIWVRDMGGVSTHW